MTRLATAALFALALAATAASAQSGLQLGKVKQLEFTKATPWYGDGFTHKFVLPIAQGDKFQVEVSAVGGAKMTLWADVGIPGARTPLEGSGKHTAEFKWKMTQAPSGNMLNLEIRSQQPGTVNILVRKLGPDGEPVGAVNAAPGSGPVPPAPGLEERVQRLEQQNAEIARQLAEIRRLLDQKK